MTRDIDMRPTTLYRAYDAAGHLLYIGIAVDWTHRWNKHRERSPWFGQVKSLSLETHPDRRSAQEAERAAIAAELPLYNRNHRGHVKRLCHFELDEADLAQFGDCCSACRDGGNYEAHQPVAVMRSYIEAWESSVVVELTLGYYCRRHDHVWLTYFSVPVTEPGVHLSEQVGAGRNFNAFTAR